MIGRAFIVFISKILGIVKQAGHICPHMMVLWFFIQTSVILTGYGYAKAVGSWISETLL